MALEEGTWAYGNAVFPLAAETGRPLLDDADPSLAAAIEFFAWGIDHYLGDRLKCEAALHGLALPSGVELKVATEPSPFLYNDQFKWPLFALYRKRDAWDEHTIAFDKSTSAWEFAYVLPPLTPLQQDKLNPILRGVSGVIRRLSIQGRDPGYLSGAEIWGEDNTRTQSVRLVECTYGGYEKIDSVGQYYRALTGTLSVRERERLVEGAYEAYAGEDIHVDHDNADETVIFPDLAQTASGPIVVSIAPDTGPTTGGTAVVVTGNGFEDGDTIAIGGVACTGVVVSTENTILCTTGPHTAAIVDVVVTKLTGAQGKLSAAYTYT